MDNWLMQLSIEHHWLSKVFTPYKTSSFFCCRSGKQIHGDTHGDASQGSETESSVFEGHRALWYCVYQRRRNRGDHLAGDMDDRKIT